MGRAVVVGGSLGGLNAALWLSDIGWDVDVLERSASPLEGRGAGIVLHPATAARTCEAGNRSRFDGTWQVGEPLPFGLYEVGDSAFTDGS